MFIDEADTFLPGNDELRGMLNSGYSRQTAYVVRVGAARAGESEGGSASSHNPGENPSRLEKFSTWCPKVISGIGRLPETVADRCIVVRMQRKLAQEQCERLRNLDGLPLKRQCARFVADHSQQIGDARPFIPPSLNDREADIWEPLLAIAEAAGGEWPEKARQAAIELSEGAHDPDPMGSLLQDILVVFKAAGTDRLFTKDLVLALGLGGTRRWTSLLKRKPLSELWLAQHLRPYEVKPRTVRIEEARARGYLLEDFEETFKRYLPDREKLYQNRSPAETTAAPGAAARQGEAV